MADSVGIALSLTQIAWTIYEQAVLAKENSAAAEDLAAYCLMLRKLLQDAEKSNREAATPATFLHGSLHVGGMGSWLVYVHAAGGYIASD